MANCPKCNAHLRLIDWKQHCPHCGANIFVYDLQERLMQQADIAEVQNYYFQKKVDRVKAAFVGSKLAITRIVTSIIPIAALFLPLVKVTAAAPLDFFSGNMSALTIYNHVDSINNEVLSALLSGSGAPLLISAVACVAVSLLATLLHLILLTLACSPKGKIRNIILDALLLLPAIVSPLLFAAIPDSAPLHGSIGYGSLLYILLQIVNVTIDILTLRQGIAVKHKQAYVGAIPIEEYFSMVESGMETAEIRAEQYKRLQLRHDEKERELKEKEKKAKEQEEKKQREEAAANGK